MAEGAADQQNKPGRSRTLAAFRALLRTRITTGIFTVLPIMLTLWVARWIFIWMRDASQWVLKAILLSGGQENLRASPILQRLQFNFDEWERLEPVVRSQYFFDLMPWQMQMAVDVVSVLLTLFLLYTVGLLAANVIGRRLIGGIEGLVDRLPLLKTVYRLPKQVIETFSADQTQNFQRAALIPFPQEKMRCVGFITSVFKDSVTGEELCTVFIPTTPNPTTGYLQVLKRRDLTELNWSIEDSIRTIMSGGILRPSFITIVPNKDLPPHVSRAGPARLPPLPTETEAPETSREPGPNHEQPRGK
jgi:uncharacterized membrane protein